MDRTIVSTEKAPAAGGPYSQAVVVGDLVFTAGQTGRDPATGAVLGEDVGTQTRQAISNLAQVLEAAGSSLSQVVRTTVFLTDMENFKAVNAAYAAYFSSNPPARTTVQVAGLAKGALIEIDAIAVR